MIKNKPQNILANADAVPESELRFLGNVYEDSLSESKIENDLYVKYGVKKGLRNENGTGVLVLLTKISDVYGYKMVDGKKVDDEGHLYYRGYDIFDLAKKNAGRFGFEKTCFLIAFSHLPDDEELRVFKDFLSSSYCLPDEFTENHILKNPSSSTMNQIQRAMLCLYSYDDNPDTTDAYKVLEKGLSIIAKMPALIAYSYRAKRHYIEGQTLHIRIPKKEYSIAENLLYMSRRNGSFTPEEAEILDLALTLHADHGGGNNSTFSNIVISSSGTDMYSAMVGSLGSLKGPRHGGANLAVKHMMEAVLSEIRTDASDEQIREIVRKILKKDFYDRSGLIYGIGHAVYTLSDPREIILKEKARELAKIKGYEDKFSFYDRFERIAKEELTALKGKACCTNIDFYSGLVYEMLGISSDLYTPIFACGRMIGWLAHNVENKLYCDKIIRPAGKYVGDIKNI